jgi:Septum formation
MFGVATLDTFAGATVPVLGTFAALPAANDGPEVLEVPAPPATPGTCLMWTRPDAADTSVVDCAEPHLFEQAGSVTLVDQTTLPDDRQWRQLVNERCNPVVLEYLGGRFDPDGRYRIGALKPSPAKWAEGDRELRCGLQSASRSGALYPLAGRVAESDQSAVREPGTCLAIDGRAIGDPVDCAGPHAVETVGIVDLSGKFSDAFPAVGDQDAFLQPECGRIANEYAGSAEVISQKGLTVYWDNLTEESWNAGTRKVNCNLAALLPDRSGFAPVTGPVRGDVVVGDQPAPPASNTPEPGAPAPTSTPAPPTDGPPAEGPPPSGTDQPQPSELPAGEQPPNGEQPPATGGPPVPGEQVPPPVGEPELPVSEGEA